MTDYKIGIAGCAGRMGQMLLREVAAAPGCRLAAALERGGHEWAGRDVGEAAGLGRMGVSVTDDPLALFAACDAVIDFTTPAATAINAGFAAQARAIHVIGTTGLSAEQEDELESAARHTAIVWAPNMSLGVNLLFALTEEVARVLDDEFDIEISEIHHAGKVDAPSGTALAMGKAAAQGRGVKFDRVAVLSREGQTGARKKGAIGFATMRGGDVVGDHTVTFAGPGERIELTHRAGSRQIFAKGALRAALWARGKPPGLYTMRDVLGLKRG
jgi:4-hydroxy-tetrahydrodipicolinate reductase